VGPEIFLKTKLGPSSKKVESYWSKFLREQWNDQLKILGGSKCLSLGE